MYTTDRSKVVVPMCSSIVYTTRRFMFDLALLFVCVFLLSFKHFDHLAWGRGSWSLCLSCICLLAIHTLICVIFLFLLVSGVGCDFCLWLFLDFFIYLFTFILLSDCGKYISSRKHLHAKVTPSLHLKIVRIGKLGVGIDKHNISLFLNISTNC